MNRSRLYRILAIGAGGLILGATVFSVWTWTPAYWKWIAAGLVFLAGSLLLQSMLLFQRRCWRYCPVCRRWVSQFGEAQLMPTPGDKQDKEPAVCSFCSNPNN